MKNPGDRPAKRQLPKLIRKLLKPELAFEQLMSLTDILFILLLSARCHKRNQHLFAALCPPHQKMPQKPGMRKLSVVRRPKFRKM